MKVLGIGEVIIDSVYQVEGPVYSHRQPTSGLVERSIGGPVPSALTLLARLGADCTLMAGIGEDAGGDMIRKHCEDEHIRVIDQPQKLTQHNLILVPRQTGERIKIRGKNRRKPIEHIDAKFLRQFDIILIDRHEPKAFYETIQKKAPHTRIVIDPSTEVSTFTLDMIRLAEIPVLPIESVSRISQKGLSENLKILYQLAQKPVIVTSGKLGAFIYDGNHMHMCPGYEVAVVDTLGAGDIFRGGLAYGLLQQWDLQKSVDFGNQVAALECTRYGNISAIPTPEEITQFTRQSSAKDINLNHVEEYFLQFAYA